MARAITMKFDDWANELYKVPPHMAPWVFEGYAWVNYVVTTNPYELRKIRRWSKGNLTGRYDTITGVSFFELEEDSVLFALRWA